MMGRSLAELVASLGWLPVEARIEKRLGTLAFLFHKNVVPNYLSSELMAVSSHRGWQNLRSFKSISSAPRVRHPILGGRAIGAAASRIWNDLSHTLRSLHSVTL